MTIERPDGAAGPGDAMSAGRWYTSEVGTGSRGRRILHVDMDAFFAAVETKEDPSLSGRPVVVGGGGNRGVVASASYEARAFGVAVGHARGAGAPALSRPGRPAAAFRAVPLLQRTSSRGAAEVYPRVEGLGLDEAFLDMSGAGGLFGPAHQVAGQLREQVLEQLGLGCSVGAGPNKLVAKLASKAAKPHATRQGPQPGPGTVVISEPEVVGFLWPMPVEALWGVGPASGSAVAQTWRDDRRTTGGIAGRSRGGRAREGRRATGALAGLGPRPPSS